MSGCHLALPACGGVPVVVEWLIPSGCLRSCFLDRCFHFSLRKLQVLLAEEPEPGSLRPVLAPGISAAHVELAALQLARGTAGACPVASASAALRLHSIHYALNE